MLDEVRTPRLVIAGTASNVGKTILTAGLIAAFKARGLTVQSFKVGPDYIDPAYLAHVSGRPCRNLDSWMLGEGALRQAVGGAGVMAGQISHLVRLIDDFPDLIIQVLPFSAGAHAGAGRSHQERS